MSGMVDKVKQEREMSQKIEDSLINDFIEKDLPNWDPVGISSESVPYLKLTAEKRKEADLDAFKYFLQRQKVQSEKNAKIKNLSYDSFLKIDRPETDLKFALVQAYKPEVPNDINAMIWNDLYNQNTGVLKEAARNGKLIIEQRKREVYLKRP